MLNKILTVTILILLVWLSNESLKIKKINVHLNKQLELVQKQLISFKEKNEKTNRGANQSTQNLLKQVLEQQKVTLKKLEKIKKLTKKKAPFKTKSQENSAKKKEPIKNLHSVLSKQLSSIDKEIENKKLSEASKKLAVTKKLLWKERNNKKFSKDKILSILSSVDLLQKKLKKGKSKGKNAYTTKIIKKKIAALNLKKESKNGTK